MKTDKNIQIKPSKKKGKSKVNIILKNELTIFSIESMKDRIIDAVQKYDTIEFTHKSVGNMDLTFIQLMHSIKKSANSLNKKILFDINLSDDLESLFINSGIEKVLI